MEQLSLLDILVILKRRIDYFYLGALALFVIGTIVILNWSDYRSEATIKIESSNISQNVTITAGSTVAPEMVIELADDRINHIQQQVTSLESLSSIIHKYNLYPQAIKTTPIALLADQMRGKIKLGFITSKISNPAAVQKQTIEDLSALAFTLSFDYSNPVLTQKVTAELVQRFLDEDFNQRRMQAQATSAFLGSQIKILEGSMAEQEKKISDFQALYGESGPAALMFNQQASVTTALSLQNIDSQITSNEGTQGSIRAQLATVDPYTRVIDDGQVLTTPAIQLKALKAQYATLSSEYGPQHPDVIKARQQIEALQQEVQNNAASDGTTYLHAEIAHVRTNLAAAKSTKGADNPDVIDLQHQLDQLEARLADSHSANGHGLRQDADNPAYLQLTSQLKSLEEQHNGLTTQRDSLVEQQAKYQRAIAENPMVEAKMATLSRDYENSQLRYRELKEKKLSADMTVQLEQNQDRQQLLVINPPIIPHNTTPPRQLLFLGVVLVALAGGVCCVILAEACSQNVQGHHHLTSITGFAPLVSVPYIITGQESSSFLRMRPFMAGVLFVIIVALTYAALPLAKIGFIHG